MKKIKINKYDNLVEWYEKLATYKDKWVYRGEIYNGDDKALKTSIEKAFELLGGHTPKHKRVAERDVIREFQRKLHLYTNNVPARPDILQWLALMQHHGAPTRLLDWTYSFWVAVHFAIERRKPGEQASLWAVNIDEIVRKYKKVRDKDNKQNPFNKKTLKKIYQLNDLPYCDPDAIYDNVFVLSLLKRPKSMVIASGSFRRNQRLTLQQGVFLIMGDITKSFQANIYSTIKQRKEKSIQLCVIEVNRKLKEDVIKALKQMNLSNAVLFPDLDGFCESLWSRVGLSLQDKVLLGNKNLILY